MNKSNHKILLSVIIVNYNGEEYLKNCLNSVDNWCNTFNHEIIIVDNNSADKSLLLIEREFPNCILIKNNENYGFAKGNNIGVSIAKGDYLLLLNNDTLLKDNIQPALDLLQKNQTIGVVGIKMLDRNSNFVSSAGKFPGFYNFLKLNTILYNTDQLNTKTSKSNNLPFEVDWLSGSFILTSKKTWQQVNGLDEDFYMYVEDIDFNKKVNQLGKKNIFFPTLEYIHYVGFKPAREKLLIESLIKYIHKHHKGISLIFNLLMININMGYKKLRGKL